MHPPADSSRTRRSMIHRSRERCAAGSPGAISPPDIYLGRVSREASIRDHVPPACTYIGSCIIQNSRASNFRRLFQKVAHLLLGFYGPISRKFSHITNKSFESQTELKNFFTHLFRHVKSCFLFLIAWKLYFAKIYIRQFAVFFNFLEIFFYRKK